MSVESSNANAESFIMDMNGRLYLHPSNTLGMDLVPEGIKVTYG